MPAKKAAPLPRRTFKLTPEMHRRACEYLADYLITDAEGMARRSQEVNKTRAFYKFPPNPSMDVHQVAASMALFIAGELLGGRLVALPPQKEEQV